MSVNQALSRFLILIAVFTVIQIALQMPYLPSPLAVRFSAAGAPVAWTSAQSFATINVVIVAIIVSAFLILPGMLSRRRRLKWRLPNREYWLAAERLPKTIEYLQRQFLWYGIVTLLFLMAVFQLVVDANKLQPPRLHVAHLGWLLASYAAFIFVWIWSLWRKFSRPPPESRDNPFG
jgi:uncharacterized membrane protein